MILVIICGVGGGAYVKYSMDTNRGADTKDGVKITTVVADAEAKPAQVGYETELAADKAEE